MGKKKKINNYNQKVDLKQEFPNVTLGKSDLELSKSEFKKPTGRILNKVFDKQLEKDPKKAAQGGFSEFDFGEYIVNEELSLKEWISKPTCVFKLKDKGGRMLTGYPKDNSFNTAKPVEKFLSIPAGKGKSTFLLRCLAYRNPDGGGATLVVPNDQLASEVLANHNEWLSQDNDDILDIEKDERVISCPICSERHTKYKTARNGPSEMINIFTWEEFLDAYLNHPDWIKPWVVFDEAHSDLSGYRNLIEGLEKTKKNNSFKMLKMSATPIGLPTSIKSAGKIESYYVSDFDKFLAINPKVFEKTTIVFCNIEEINLEPLKKVKINFLILNDGLKEYASDIVRSLDIPYLIFADSSYSNGFSFGDVNVISTGVSQRKFVDENGNKSTINVSSNSADLIQQKGRASREKEMNSYWVSTVSKWSREKLRNDYIGEEIERYFTIKKPSDNDKENLKNIIKIVKKPEKMTKSISSEEGKKYLKLVLARKLRDGLKQTELFADKINKKGVKINSGEFIFVNPLMTYFEEIDFSKILKEVTEKEVDKICKKYSWYNNTKDVNYFVFSSEDAEEVGFLLKSQQEFEIKEITKHKLRVKFKPYEIANAEPESEQEVTFSYQEDNVNNSNLLEEINTTKALLATWTEKFPFKNPEDVEKDIERLRKDTCKLEKQLQEDFNNWKNDLQKLKSISQRIEQAEIVLEDYEQLIESNNDLKNQIEDYRKILINNFGITDLIDWEEELNLAQTQISVIKDRGWLTDDNIEYILKNHKGIQQKLDRNWTVRADLANLYNCFSKAKNKLEWDLADFVGELDVDHPYQPHYTIFPLRVSGNHWGVLVISENKKENKRVFYTSSSSENEIKKEIEQIKPLIIQLIDQDAANEIQIINGAKQSNNGYDCGVYLVKYIQEFLETDNLTLNGIITEQDCQVFRQEWKTKIGAEKWCKWDAVSEEDIEGDQFQLTSISQINVADSIKNISLTDHAGDNKTTVSNSDDESIKRTKLPSFLNKNNQHNKSSVNPFSLETTRKGDMTLYLQIYQNPQLTIALEIQNEQDLESLENDGYWDKKIQDSSISDKQRIWLQTVRHHRLIEISIDTETVLDRLKKGEHWDMQISGKLLTNYQRLELRYFRQQKLIQLSIEREDDISRLEEKKHWDKQIKSSPITKKFFRQKIDLQIVRQLRLNKLERQRDLIYNQIRNRIQEEKDTDLLTDDAWWNEKVQNNYLTDQQQKDLQLLRNYRILKLDIKEETNPARLENNDHWDKLIQTVADPNLENERQITGLQIFRKLQLEKLKEKNFVQITNGIQEECNLYRLEDKGYWDDLIITTNSLTEKQRNNLQIIRHRQRIQIGIQAELDVDNLADKEYWDNEIKNHSLTDQQKVCLQTLRKTFFTKVNEITKYLLASQKRKATYLAADFPLPMLRPSASAETFSDSGYTSSKGDNEELEELKKQLEEKEEGLADLEEELEEKEEKLKNEIQDKRKCKEEWKELKNKVDDYFSKYNEIWELLKKTEKKVIFLEQENAELKKGGSGSSVSQENIQQKEMLNEKNISNKNDQSVLLDTIEELEKETAAIIVINDNKI